MAPQLYWILLLSTCAYAMWRGSGELKVVTLACLIASVATNVLSSTRYSGYTGYRQVEVGVMGVDFALFALFVFVALRSQRFWPLWIAGLHLVTVMAHWLKSMKIDLMPSAYAIAAQFWSYPIIVILGIGVWRHHRRTRMIEREPQP